MNEKAGAVRLMLFDVDGVMTDGGLYYTDSGEEIKVFNTLDGLGIKMLRDSGVRVGIITGRTSRIVEQRARHLGIDYVFQGVHDKLAAFVTVQQQAGVDAAQCGFMGDDLVDLPVLRRAGLAVAVPEAPELVRSHVHYVTGQPGGRGAVREVCELIMRAQGTLDAALAPFLV